MLVLGWIVGGLSGVFGQVIGQSGVDCAGDWASVRLDGEWIRWPG